MPINYFEGENLYEITKIVMWRLEFLEVWINEELTNYQPQMKPGTLS